MINAFKMRIDNIRCRIFVDWLEAIYNFFCVVEPSTVISVQSFIISGI